MNAFTIKDLENLSGVKAHTLRIWEQRYQFLKPSRTFTNIRYYSNDELKTILKCIFKNVGGVIFTARYYVRITCLFSECLYRLITF